MLRVAIISLSFIFQAQAGLAATSCNNFLQAFNEYTQKVEGKLVKKHSIFEVTDWSRNSRFQGLVLTDKAPANAEVVLESKAAGKKAKALKTTAKKTTPFAQDNKYRVVELDVEKQLTSAPTGSGNFIVRVLADGKELCAEKRLIYDDGD